MAFLAIAFLFLGLYKPWWALWWADTQNRLQVILLYGSLGIIFTTMAWALFSLAELS